MKITDVQLFVLKSEGLYNNPDGSEEPLGPTYMGVVRVSTDEGISGYSDLESNASVAKACVDAPKWSQDPGMECFDGLATLLVGENPLEVERLWYKMHRSSIYYGRRGSRFKLSLRSISPCALGGVSAARRVRGVQYVARTAKPDAGKRAAANERWVSSRSDRTRFRHGG